MHLANLRMNRLELESARELAGRAVALTVRVDDPGLVAGAHFQLGEVLFFMGALATSREHLERTLQLLGPGPRRNIWETVYAGRSAEYLVYVTALWGYPDTALKRSREVLSTARRFSDPESIAIALDADARLNWILGDVRKVLERAEEMLALATDHHMGFWMLIGSALRASALAAQGQVEEGIAELQRARQAAAASALLLLMVLSALAEAYLKGRRPEEGLEVIADGLARAQKSGVGFFEPILHSIKGDLLLLRDAADPAEAEDCFRQVIQIAQGQSNKLAELGATMSLAGLLDKQGKRDEARAILADIYGWFSEGFDTPVLKNAKALLDELGV